MGRKNKRKQKGTKSLSVLTRRILDMFETNAGANFNPKQVAKKLGIHQKDLKSVIPHILNTLESNGSIIKSGRHSYRSNRPSEVIEGTVDHVSRRFAYILNDVYEQDIWIKGNNLNNALHQDRVKVMVFAGKKHGRKPEGKVLQILERKRSEFVGRIENYPDYSFVVPDNKKVHSDIFVRPGDTMNAKNNDKVVVSIVEWPGRDKSPIGKVIRVLGEAGNNEAEIHSIMAEFGLPFEFPVHVTGDADKIATEIPDTEIRKRRDFRKVTTFTIDPEDAKDFDDALSFKRLKNGNLEIGVHIADVSHYLKSDTPLDKEAFKRATSVYLVDRTIPMLPEKLSNELCSLRPEEEKLTFSAVFEIGEDAIVKNQWFGKTIIRSDRRYTYEEAQEIIDGGKGNHSEELKTLNTLARKLRAQRFEEGAINFETVEVRFDLDDEGKPVGIIPKVRKDAHKMIEEFMLLANRRVAEYINELGGSGAAKYTFVYRTHDYPDPDKIYAFSAFAKKFGHQLNTNEGSLAKSLNSLMTDIEGKPEQNVLENLAIRAMAKAKYTTNEGGHFGLSFDHYTHFTSPIRRYPDVMVHRLLFHYLSNGKSGDRESYEERCLHSSLQEKNASDAERASIKYKQVEYMQSALGEEFEGIISGLTEWGIFVEIVENKCEGMMRISELYDDYYEFDETNFRVVGKRNKRIFSLGDSIQVRVVATDIDRRTIDLELAEF